MRILVLVSFFAVFLGSAILGAVLPAFGFSVEQALSSGAILWLGFASFMLFGFPALMVPRQKSKGEWIAEVFLVWELGKGSIMYRQRFGSMRMAHIFAKFYAMYLDAVLPTHYRAEDWSGRPYWEKHEYGINFGVRKLADEYDELPVLSTALPGYPGYSGVR